MKMTDKFDQSIYNKKYNCFFLNASLKLNILGKKRDDEKKGTFWCLDEFAYFSIAPERIHDVHTVIR